MPTFDTSGPVTADIVIGAGHVEIIATDRPGVVAEVSPSRPGRSGDQSLAREAVVAFEGDRLRVSVPKRLNLFGQSDSVDVRVELPTGSDVQIEAAYGSVRTSGTLAASRITAKYGDVTGDTVGDLTLTSPYGAVDIARVDGRLDATLGHGHLRIGHVAGDAHLRGSHGTIELGTAAGALDIVTSGVVTIDRALGDVTGRSAHGAIRVREAAGGSLQLENGYASIEVGIPQGVAAWVDAASAHGTVRNELTPDPSGAAADRTVELRLRANWADILIRRAASATSKGATK
jgi:hypothetical protein